MPTEPAVTPSTGVDKGISRLKLLALKNGILYPA